MAQEFVRDLADRAIAEAKGGSGKLESPDLVRLFRDSRALTESERLLRRELFFLLYDLCEGSLYRVKKVCGLHHDAQRKMLRDREQMRQGAPEIQELVNQHTVELEEVRFQGRKQLIELFYEGAARGLDRGLREIPDMKGLDAIKTAAIRVDKALLLSGQPTSRIAKTDERMMSDEELQERLRKYESEAVKLTVLTGQGGKTG